MINLAVSGCQGRMGQRVTQLALEDPAFKVASLLEHPNHPKANESIEGIKVSTDPDSIQGSDVFIDFTLPDGTITNLNTCVKHNVKMVIGTTGFSDAQIDQIKKASEKIAIVFSSNMSVGVNVFWGLSKTAGERTKDKYTVAIEETHHIHKKDKPSGTAKTLAEFVAEGSGSPVTDIESIREGEVIGDHSVTFDSPEDTITITHHAKNRDIFAKGALVAAKFLADKEKGLFHMQDVLGLR